MIRDDLTGKRFGFLTVLGVGESRKRTDRDHGTQLFWRCQCDCGEIRLIERGTLRKRFSCGCKRAEMIGDKVSRHGHTRNRKTSAEYRAWSAMSKRTKRPSEKDKEAYRGVTVCERWESFEAFYEDMGPKPSPTHSIDRIDNSKGYEPGNCRWATKREQSLNRRNTVWLTFNGKTMCLSDWARELGVPIKSLQSRWKKRMPVERILYVGNLKHAA